MYKTVFISNREENQGMIFDLDQGVRLDLSINGNEFASDPDIFVGRDDLYYMYVSRGQGTQVFVSTDTLRGEYRRLVGLQKTMVVSLVDITIVKPIHFGVFTSKNVPKPWIQEIRYEIHRDFDTQIQLADPLFLQDDWSAK